MEELTIEQKVRAYDEAVKEAFIAYKDEDKHLKETLERIFPELKVSEDEKIRKELTEFLKSASGGFLDTSIKCKTYSKWVVWLKKQDNFSKKDVDNAYLKGVADTKNEIEKQYEANYQIRKDIATFIFNYKGDIKDRAKWMNYLGIKVSFVENQDEDKEINNFDVLPGLYKCVHRMFDGTPDGKLLFEIGNLYKCLSKHDIAEFEVSYGHSIYLQDPVVCKHFIPFEKQGEKPQGKSALEAILEEKIDNTNNIEPKDYSSIDPHFGKPIDKVNPKFHEGEWTVSNLDRKARQISEIHFDEYNSYYVVDGKEFNLEEYDRLHHSWTIKDAKDGDVLATEDKNFTTPFVAIYKSIGDTVYDNITFNSHCFIGFDGNFYGGEEGHTIEDIHPATKEQRELLSQKMKEVGYEWEHGSN